MLGAAPGEVVVTDSTTVNLYKLVSAALDAPAARRLVTDRGNFPTDRYVLEGIAAARGLELRLFDSDPLDGPQPTTSPRAAPATSSCSATSPTARARWPTWPRSPRPPATAARR